jgi:hypothetical protein
MRINNSFLIGLATGLCLGYYLTSEDKEEIIEGVKKTANKVRDAVDQGIEKGKKLVAEAKSRREE